ncbi:MAG TPA: hypothetical protein VF727_14000 [Allosphingosinicella sp.]|jgi:hypothetical protein
MKSALMGSFLGFAATAAALQVGVLPNSWDKAPNAEASAFAARHASEDKAEIRRELELKGA